MADKGSIDKMKILRIATRTSPLALWQAHYVQDQLKKINPDYVVELLPLITQADKQPSVPLADIGGKGLFIKELENALLDGRADMAVHSIKDMTVDLTDGLILHTVCKREDPRDVFLSTDYKTILDLPAGAIIGSSSLRRQCQLKTMRPDLHVKPLRGNVETRLTKLSGGEFSAIILAAAGLKRLGKTEHISSYLEIEDWLPAVGQAAIGVECRADDALTMGLLIPLDDTRIHTCISAERAMNKYLGGSCWAPIAGYAVLENTQLTLRGLVGSLDGKKIIHSSAIGSDAEETGRIVANDLLAQGAGELLKIR